MKIGNIKFKAKRLDNSEWVEGSLVITNLIGCDDPYAEIVTTDGMRYEVDPSTVCQFTGMRDEDGTEIWEHDILKNFPMENEVIFKNGSFMIIEDYDDDIVEVDLSTISLEEGVLFLKVIGNKFDRKEGEK